MTPQSRVRSKILAAVAIGAAAMTLGACQSSDESSADPSSSPPAPASSEPSSSPSPSEVTATWPPAELEALTPADPVDEGEPTAYEAPEWLWDWVDDSWSTAIYSTLEFTHPDGESPGFEGVQWLYLLAPDGAAFRIADLGDAANATIVDWDPGHRKAWLHLQGFSEERDVAEVDLLTGAVDTDDFTDGAGPRRAVENESLALDILPRVVAPDGARLWVDIDPLGSGSAGAVWYDPSTGDWTASAINDVLFDIAEARHERREGDPRTPTYVHASAWMDLESQRAIYVSLDGGDLEEGEVQTYAVIDHDLATDTWVSTTIDGPDSTPHCEARGPLDAGVLVECWSNDTSIPDTAWAVDPATGEISSAPADSLPGAQHDLGDYTEDVKAQGAQPPNADDWTDVMPAPRPR